MIQLLRAQPPLPLQLEIICYPSPGTLPARLRPFSSLPLLTGNGPPSVPPPRPNPRPPSGRSTTSLWLCLLCESLCSGAVGGGWRPRPLEALLVCWGHQGEIVVTSSGQFSCLLWIHPRKSSLPRGYHNDVAQVVLEITECLRGKTNGGFSSHGNGIYLQRSPRVRAGQL